MLGIAALVCAQILTPLELGHESLVFATGREGGNYYALGQALAQQRSAWCPGCEIELRVTGGSYDNARLLRDGEADLALIQSDVAYLEYFEGRPYLAVAAPYIEPIHIVVRRELGLTKLSELVGYSRQLRAVIGPAGSGSASHGLTLLHELESEGASFEILQGDLSEGFSLLRDRKADVAFVTSAVPVKAVQDLAAQDAIGLLDVDADLARRLKRKNPFFSLAEIPYQAYGGTRRDVTTLGTLTLLVVHRDFPASRIDGLLDTLYRLGGPEPSLPFLSGLSADLDLEELAIPGHPKAVEYHRRHRTRMRELIAESRRFVVPIAVLVMPLLIVLWLPRTAYFVHQFVLGRIFVLLVTVWLAGSAAMHILEGDKNSSFRSFGNSAVAILYYLFSGFETKFPITVAGHVVAIIVLSLGVAVVTLFTATVATLLLERALNVRRIRAKPPLGIRLKDHVVLVGWSERAERILKHLRSRDIRPRPVVVVASAEPPRPKKISTKTLRGTWMVTAEEERERLERADLSTAKIALVLGPECGRRTDWLVTSSALALDRVAPSVHSVVEVSSSECCESLRDVRTDEIVVTETLGERLVSQCAITPGISAVYNELLTFGVGSQEIYLSPVPRPLSGQTFREIRRRLMTEELVPIGYRSQDRSEFRVNPRGDGGELRSDGHGGDQLVFVADTRRALPRRNRRFVRVPSRHEGGSMSTAKTRPQTTVSAPETTIGICGWSSEARSVIEQLQETVIAAHQRFSVTVISEPDRTGFSRDANGDLHEHVRFVIGDPTRRLVLKNAGVGDFRSLVIMADRSDPESAAYSDHRALMIALSATAVNPSLHIIVELLHSENREHFERLSTVEVVSVEELAEKLLAQAVVNPGITDVYLELLTATEESNEVYIVPVPDLWLGKAYEDVYLDLLQGGEAVIPIGYRTPAPGGSGQVVILNPAKKRGERNGVSDWRGHALAEGDGLVVVAYEQPDLSAIAERVSANP
jgi:TRAP transporter TAXI family solute receptor